MKRHILSGPAHGILAAFLTLGAVPASGQETRLTFSGDDASTVLAMEEAGDVLRITVGHSKLLLADEPFGTIIVGDETIANANVGAGNSIIVTGQQAGSTNLIVLGESQRMLMSSTVTVVPVAGPLRSTVTVMKGTETSERYECRGINCTLVDSQDQPTEMSFLLTPTSPETAADSTDSADSVDATE